MVDSSVGRIAIHPQFYEGWMTGKQLTKSQTSGALKDVDLEELVYRPRRTPRAKNKNE